MFDQAGDDGSELGGIAYDVARRKAGTTIIPHQFRGAREAEAGRYRRSNVMIGGASHIPPQAVKVPRLMEEFVAWYHEKAHSLSAAELAARVHYKLVHMHPFTDGNGRTAIAMAAFSPSSAGPSTARYPSISTPLRAPRNPRNGQDPEPLDDNAGGLGGAQGEDQGGREVIGRRLTPPPERVRRQNSRGVHCMTRLNWRVK